MFFKIEGITKAYGGLVANSDVSIEIEKNEIIGLIGPNGAGKSTLFQIIQGFIKPDTGHIYFDSKDLTNLSTNQICHHGVACTFQHAQLFPDLDVLESVMIGAYCRIQNRQKAMKLARELIAFAGLEKHEGTTIDRLNMFDRKRVELTAALATKPKLLLLDELFAGLNPTEVMEMINLTKKIHNELEITLFIIEHVLKVITTICDRVYVLDYGKIIAECRPEEIALKPEVIKAYLGEDYDASDSK